MERDRHNRTLDRGVMSRNALDAALQESAARNHGRSGLNGAAPAAYVNHQPLLNSETLIDVEKREGNNVLDRLHYLDAHFEVQHVPQPVLPVNPLEYTTRADQVCAALVDFPMSMVIEQHAQHTGNFDAQITFCRDRMKEVSVRLNAALKRVLLDVERDRFKAMFNSNVAALVDGYGSMPLNDEQLIEMWDDLRGFDIDQQCTPLTTLEQIQQLYDNAFIAPETAAERMCHILGMPPSDVSVVAVKRQAEIDTERLELDQKVADANISMQRESAEQSHQLETEKLELARETQAAAAATAASSQKPAKKAKK